MPDNLSVIRNSFTGGMNSEDQTLILGDDEVAFINNMTMQEKPGALQQIKVPEDFQTIQTATTRVKSLFRFYKSDGTAVSLASWQDGATFGVSTYTVSSETQLPITNLNANITDWAVFQDRLYFVNGFDAILYEWNGVDPVVENPFPTIGSGPFKPAFVEMHRGRAYYGGDPELRSTFIFSEPNDPTDIPAINFITVDDDDGDFLTGIKKVGPDLIIFKERNPFLVDGSPPQRVVRLQGPGSIEQKTIQRSPELGLIYLSRFGIHLLGNGQFTLLSAKAGRLVQAAIDNAAGQFSSAFRNNVYYLFFKPSISPFISEGFSLNFNFFLRGDNRIPIMKLKGFQIKDSVVFDGSVDENEWFGADSDSNKILNVAGPNSATDSLIRGQFEDFGSSSREKQLFTIFIYAHTPVKNMCITIFGERDGIRKNYGPFCLTDDSAEWNDGVWNAATWGGEFLLKSKITLPAGIFVNRAQLKFATLGNSSDVMSLDGYEIHYQLLPEV